MRVSPFRSRSHVRLTKENVNMLSLAEAVRRNAVDGTFLMSERSEDGGFEGDSNDIDPSSVISHLSKVETALRGIDLAGKTIVAPASDSKDSDSQ